MNGKMLFGLIHPIYLRPDGHYKWFLLQKVYNKVHQFIEIKYRKPKNQTFIHNIQGLFVRNWVWITNSKVLISFITENNCSIESEGSFLHSWNVKNNKMICGQRNSCKWYIYEIKKKKKAGSGIECLRQMALGLILSRNFYSLFMVFRPGIYLNKSF